MVAVLLPVAQLTLSAQDLTGIWKGYFISDGGDQYKLEFQVAQNNTNTVTGVSYSYLDIRFYGKATMTGSFIKTSSSFRIREIRTVEVKSVMGGATCIMNYIFNYVKSGKEEFLEGSYLGKFESKSKPVNPMDKPAWGDCGGGKVYLHKVAQSDFYVEPFLRGKIKTNTPMPTEKPMAKKDSVKIKVTTPAKPLMPLVKKPVITNSSKPVVKNNVPAASKPIVKNTVPASRIRQKIDSVQTKAEPVIKNNPPMQIVTIIPDVLKNRSNEVLKTLTVNNADVTVKLYDNGEIDGDSISVYFDKKLVLSNKGLTTAPLILNLKMDGDGSDHELTMVAENLGRIPPNTSLMIVESGEQRFEVRITSTEQKNAVVRFKYVKPN